MWNLMPERVVMGCYKHVIGVRPGTADHLLRTAVPVGTVCSKKNLFGGVFEVSDRVAIVVLDEPFGTVVPRRGLVESFNRVSRNFMACDIELIADVLQKFVETVIGKGRLLRSA